MRPSHIPVNEQIKWKLGMITRTVKRLDKNTFIINDTSDGLVVATATLSQMRLLETGRMNLDELDYEATQQK